MDEASASGEFTSQNFPVAGAPTPREATASCVRSTARACSTPLASRSSPGGGRSCAFLGNHKKKSNTTASRLRASRCAVAKGEGSKFLLPVDREHKACEIRLYSFAAPHMRCAAKKAAAGPPGRSRAVQPVAIDALRRFCGRAGRFSATALRASWSHQGPPSSRCCSVGSLSTKCRPAVPRMQGDAPCMVRLLLRLLLHLRRGPAGAGPPPTVCSPPAL